MDGAMTMMKSFEQRFIDKTVAIPMLFLVMRFRQRDGFLDESSKGIGLRQGLTIELVYPLGRTIGRDDD